MKYEITQNQLQAILNLITSISNTHFFTPSKYTKEVIPFMKELQELPIVKEEVVVEKDKKK